MSKENSFADSDVRDFFTLLKPRVMSLVVFTGFVGLYIAPGIINPFIAIIAIFCIALGSGSAGAINMWYERDVDAIMERTKKRPIPSKKILPQTALEFAVIVALFSVIIMGLATNMVAAFLLLVAICFYVFVYTIWLKRRTPQNIVIGGAAGAFPPMIGWAAVTGNVTIESIILFLIIFLWTPPHFWALALYKSDDYQKAGIPMLPVVAGEEETRRQIMIYTIVLGVVSFIPVAISMFSIIYTLSCFFLNLHFLKLAFSLYEDYSEDKARKLFKYSIIYLFLLFVAMLVDKTLI